MTYHGVGVHGLLFDVAHEAVASLGADEVREEEGVVHDALADHDRKPEEWAGLLELKEGQQVHPLVLGLLEKGVDPAVVPVQRGKAFQQTHYVGKEGSKTQNER